MNRSLRVNGQAISLFVFYLFSLFRHLRARDQKKKAKHTLKVEEVKDFSIFQGKKHLEHS